MADNVTLFDILNDIALAVQNRLASSGKYRAIDFASAILEIGKNADATAVDVKLGKKAYVNGKYVDGSFKGESITVKITKDGITYVPDYGKYYSSVVVPAEPNLLPQNIKKGVTIFGVTGTLTYAMLGTPLIALASSTFSTVLFMDKDGEGESSDIIVTNDASIFYTRGD